MTADRQFAAAVLAACAAGLAGCATRPAAPVHAAAAPAAARGAVIVSARPLAAPGSADIRRSILGALGTPAAGGQTFAGGLTFAGATEFIVRQDGGQTLSVVQPGDALLRPGARVVLQGGAATRLALLTGG